MTPEEKLSILIRKWRNSRGLSQKEFILLADLHTIPDNWSISRIETGKKRIKLNDAIKIAKILKIKLEDL